jgi:hypothetical protein
VDVPPEAGDARAHTHRCRVRVVSDAAGRRAHPSRRRASASRSW